MNPSALGVRLMAGALSICRGPVLSTLIFHRVLEKPDPLMPDEPDAESFQRRLEWLAAGFRILPLIEAVRRLRDGSLPSNAACITFDDGYADNLTVAAPILARLRIPATFFISTGYLDGGRMWDDTVIEVVRACGARSLDLTAFDCGVWSCTDAASRTVAIRGILRHLKYLPQAERQKKVDAMADAAGLAAHSRLMMTRDQVRELRRFGMSIGAHTVTHPILTTLSAGEARAEIADGRRELEDIVGERVKLFAYPNGRPLQDYDASHVRLVRDMDFVAAVSTSTGVAHRESDPFQLPRFTPWDATIPRFGARLGANLLRKRYAQA